MQTLGAKPARKKLSDRIEEMHGICISDMNYCTGHLVEFNCGSSLQIPPNTVCTDAFGALHCFMPLQCNAMLQLLLLGDMQLAI